MRVLLIGLGSIAKKHVAAIHSIDSTIEVYALRSSSSSEPWQNVKDLYSYDEIKTDWFDFVIISNPTSEHLRSIEILSYLNIPLFIEKPLFHLLSIEKTVKKIEKQGILTYVACNLRFLDSLNFIKEYLENRKKKINEINVYCGSYLPEWRKDCDFRKVYSAIPELGGGVHIDLIHEIDYLYWMFGNPIKTNRILSNKSSLEITAYDYANYCLEYPLFYTCIILNYYRRDAKRTMEIVFEDETILVDLINNNVVCNEKVIYRSDQKVIDTYKLQMKYFINCVKERKNTFNTITDAYNVLKICLEQ